MTVNAILKDELVPGFCRSRVLIIGCGNILFGDDGFGPAAVEFLKTNYVIPPDISIMDAGTATRELFYTIALSPVKPGTIIIIDTFNTGKKPGEILTDRIENLSVFKTSNFSVHQQPTSSFLLELKTQCEVTIILVAVQPEFIPDSVKPGLSATVQAAIRPVCDYIISNLL